MYSNTKNVYVIGMVMAFVVLIILVYYSATLEA